jgi:hypothetical protein
MTTAVYRSLAERPRYEEAISPAVEEDIELPEDGVGQGVYVELQDDDSPLPNQVSTARVCGTLVAATVIIALSTWSVLHSLRSL